MKKLSFLIAVLALSGAVAHAQIDGGTSSGPCDDSPENPTALLAVIGTSGAGLAALRVRLQARRNKK